MMKTIPLLAVTALTLNACATERDSIVLGIGIGSVIGGVGGAAAGAPSNNSTRAGIAGAAIGAAIGGLAGYLQHKEDDEKKKDREAGRVFPDDNAPYVTKPVVKQIWVDDKIEDNVLVRGHWQYVITRPSTWSKPSHE